MLIKINIPTIFYERITTGFEDYFGCRNDGNVVEKVKIEEIIEYVLGHCYFDFEHRLIFQQTEIVDLPVTKVTVNLSPLSVELCRLLGAGLLPKELEQSIKLLANKNNNDFFSSIISLALESFFIDLEKQDEEDV